MKKMGVLFFCFFCFFYSTGQVVLTIKEIVVSNVKICNNSKKKIPISNFSGPHLTIGVLFENYSDTFTYKLYPSRSRMSLSFNFNDVRNVFDIFSLDFQDYEELNLLPGQRKEAYYDCDILLEAGLFNYNYDYSKEIIEILPTIKIKYIDKETELISDQILKVRCVYPTNY